MTPSRSHLRSPYMEFSKLGTARYNLSASGVMGMTWAELGASASDLELHGAGPYGYEPLIERIARYNGVSPECVVTANGCSMANHLAFAAAFDPGDEVLLEQPTYELLFTTLQFLEAEIRRFPRRPEEGFAVDVREIKRRLTARTRLIVLCNLHNPTSARVDEATLAALGDLAAEVGAHVLVDEVYLESICPRPRTTLQLGPQFVVTSSLTKAYGLSGLRCGWILCEPELADRIRHINDLFGVQQPNVADRLSVFAFDHLEQIRARAQLLLASNRPMVLDFVRSRDELECFVPEQGTTLSPRLKQGSVDQLAQLLREKYDTMIVPGSSYFEMPGYFRLGLGIDTNVVREGLKRLGAALDEIC